MRFYPKSVQGRKSARDPAIRKSRLAVLKAVTVTAILLNLLFLALYSYIFGSLYQENSHIHNLNVVFVDYDASLVGESFRQTYLQQLQGNNFPGIIEQPISKYPTPALLETAVCHIEYWAALYISPNATARLASALQGGTGGLLYNRSDIITMIWNEARYPAVVDIIPTALETLSNFARITYSGLNGSAAIQTVNTTDQSAIAAFTNPWTLTSINIQPTTQGSRAIYNTIVIILILLQQFFFLATMNGVASQFQLFSHVYPSVIILTRFLISVVYTLGGSLCTAGAIWAFRGGWAVNGNQWVLTWLSLWLFAHVNFVTFDAFSKWIPAPYMPMALVTWVILNVGSILLPFELTPGFYKWSYMMPAHAIFQLLVDIWSRGCNPLVAYALPVLFGFDISSSLLCVIGVYRQCHYAAIAAEQEEKRFQEKVAGELDKYTQRFRAYTRGEDAEQGAAITPVSESRTHPDSIEDKNREKERLDQDEFAESIWRSASSLRQEESQISRKGSLIPSFEMPFT
ncbi:hypothetical protein DPV78_009099 [Talaromyces pinophilus]|nr:hypothetical protein DPV78_009099 [Talaromyces pinophilus]